MIYEQFNALAAIKQELVLKLAVQQEKYELLLTLSPSFSAEQQQMLTIIINKILNGK